MVEIHLYGNLRRYGHQTRPGQKCVVGVEVRPGATVSSILAQAGIPVEEVNHVFLDSRLLASRARAAVIYGYLQSRDDVHDWDLEVPVGPNARLGLFGLDMALLSM